MAEEAPKTTPPATAEGEHHAPTSSDLMTSARTLASAAQAAATKQTDKIDKEKVAEAAENVLEAVKSNAKVNENEGVGQYLNKAEGYLHSMHSSGDGAQKADKGEEKKESGGEGGSAAGLMKMAQGFFK